MRGIEWFLNKKWVWKIFAQSRNLGSICNGYQSLVFERICVSESRLFLTMGLVFWYWGLAVLQSLEFTIIYPYNRTYPQNKRVNCYGPPCVKKFRNLGMVPKISQWFRKFGMVPKIRDGLDLRNNYENVVILSTFEIFSKIARNAAETLET